MKKRKMRQVGPGDFFEIAFFKFFAQKYMFLKRLANNPGFRYSPLVMCPRSNTDQDTVLRKDNFHVLIVLNLKFWYISGVFNIYLN